jgi:hypothetical protein
MKTIRLLPLLAIFILASCQKKNYNCTCYQAGKENDILRYKILAGDRKCAAKDCQYQAVKLNTTNGSYICQLTE